MNRMIWRLCAALLLISIGACAQTWTVTNSMTTTRAWQIAVLLQNGEVLVAGGNGSAGTTLSSAELYNPGSGTWSGAGAMSTPRFAAQAVLLPSGKVLVAGGCSSNCTQANSTAELYDLNTGTWSTTGTMSTARYFFTATLLNNGEVLAVGGCNVGNCNTVTGTAEVYDPATGQWASVGSLSAPRDYHAASLLSSGKVLIEGGLWSERGHRECGDLRPHHPRLVERRQHERAPRPAHGDSPGER